MKGAKLKGKVPVNKEVLKVRLPKAQETTLTTEHLQHVDPTFVTDARDEPLPWRVCTDAELPPGTRAFDVGTLPVDPEGAPADALRDYADFVRYVQSTQGHLNGGEGLCAIHRNYPSPP